MTLEKMAGQTRTWSFFPLECSRITELTLRRLKRRLDRTKGNLADDRTDQLSRDFDGNIETGFQIATFQGPLCAEPVEGIAYFVERVEIDKDGVEKERRMYNSSLMTVFGKS